VTNLSNISVCKILTSRLETIFKQTIVVNLVRETGYRVTKLVEHIQRVSPNLNGEKFQKKISTLVKVIKTLHDGQPESPDKAIEWNETAGRLQHLPDTEKINPGSFNEKKLERASSALCLLLDDVKAAFSARDVSKVTENVAEKLQSTRGDRLQAIEGLVTGLVLNIIRKKDFRFQELVLGVKSFSSDAVVEALNRIRRMKEDDVQNRDDHRIIDPQKMKDFTDSYTTCVEFYIKDFNCFSLLSEQMVSTEAFDYIVNSE